MDDEDDDGEVVVVVVVVDVVNDVDKVLELLWFFSSPNNRLNNSLSSFAVAFVTNWV